MRMRMSWVLLVVLCGLMAMGLPAAAQDEFVLITDFDELPEELRINGPAGSSQILQEGDDSYLHIETQPGTRLHFGESSFFDDFMLVMRLRAVGGSIKFYTNRVNTDCRGFEVVINPSADYVALNEYMSCSFSDSIGAVYPEQMQAGEWFDLEITLDHNTLTIAVNGEFVIDGRTLMSGIDIEPSITFEPHTARGEDSLDIAALTMTPLDYTVAQAGEGRTSREEEPEVVLTEFDPTGTQQEIIDSLRVMGYLPEDGGSFLFGEDYAYFFGQGNWFTPLASRSPRTDVVMAGDLTFTYGDSDDLQSCGLMAHVSVDGSGTTTQLLQAGIDNAGYAYIFDAASQDDVDYYDDFIGFESGDTVHLLFIVIGGNTSLFINGEPVIDREKTDNRSGSYGISLTGRTADDGCEGRNIWVWSFDE
jgi:hypothetical protein